MFVRIVTTAAALAMTGIGAFAQVPPRPPAPEVPLSLGLAQCPANCAAVFQNCIDARVGRPLSGALSLQANPPRQVEISRAIPSDEAIAEADAMKSHAAAAESCKPVSAACNARCG
jgi:hypothetical protein